MSRRQSSRVGRRGRCLQQPPAPAERASGV